jgi:hypothetical protein
VRVIVKDLYEDARSTLQHKGSRTNPIKWTKGVKQGCILSPLLINLCIEPLPEATKRNEHVSKTYVKILKGTVRFLIQVYAHAVLFISEKPEGICQWRQIRDKFVAAQRRKSMNINGQQHVAFVSKKDDELT